MHAEEVTELGVLAVEDRARFADRVLAACERVDRHRVVVARHGVGVVADLQPLPVEAIGELDVFPSRGRKRRVEWVRGQEFAIDGDVRRVEEVERHDVAVAN